MIERFHSQISVRILSLSLFHKFVKIRACGHQRAPDVVFWLKLVSVPGFKNDCIVEKQLHNRMQLNKNFLLPADTVQRDLVPLSGHPLKIESDRIAVDFAAQSAVQQCNPLHNEPAALAPQKGFAHS